jgi:cation:H+ antiporter
MEFSKAPKPVLLVPVLAVLLMGGLGWDGTLSRLDGALLLGAFFVAVLYLLWLGRRGLAIEATGEVAEALEEAEELSKWRSLGLLLLSLAAIVAGSELLVLGSRTIIDEMGVSDTVFGMTILAFLVSIEELARELPAAMKGRPEITYGNVAGSVLAFFLFNAGIIALVNPLPMTPRVLEFYLPLALATVLFISLFMAFRKVPRWAGGLLVLLYLLFVARGYLG